MLQLPESTQLEKIRLVCAAEVIGRHYFLFTDRRHLESIAAILLFSYRAV